MPIDRPKERRLQREAVYRHDGSPCRLCGEIHLGVAPLGHDLLPTIVFNFEEEGRGRGGPLRRAKEAPREPLQALYVPRRRRAKVKPSEAVELPFTTEFYCSACGEKAAGLPVGRCLTCGAEAPWTTRKP